MLATFCDAIKDEDTEKIRRLPEELQNAAHKLARTLYGQQAASGQTAGPAPDAEQAAQSGTGAYSRKTEDDEVVDAEYSEVA